MLTLDLVVQPATWQPEGTSGCGIGVYAIAEAGKPAQLPGPLIRIPVGTELKVSIRNTLEIPLVLRGLQDHLSPARDSVRTIPLAPAATESITVRITRPGTYYYLVRPPAPQPIVPANEYTGAVGAFIVDSAGSRGADRVLVMTRWRGPPNSSARAQGYELTAFNGLSWPHTERIVATVGDTVRWRVIAANNDGHSMHLHGFYYTVESRGDVAYDSLLAPEAQPTVVSMAMFPGSTMTLRWVPERAGNWIFHCHLLRHMSGNQRLDRMPGAAGGDSTQASAQMGHALHDMAGLVLGITVRSSPGAKSGNAEGHYRPLDLYAGRRERVFGERPGYGFVLQQGGDRPPAPDSIRIPGSALFLERGQPVQITVHNRMGRPLAVHWHGIELESYFDGVAGWSGMEARTAPVIAVGDTFVARFTPPRAGTFIYHVHNEATEELVSGLYGPLVVLEPGRRFDPRHERMFVVGEAGPGDAPGAERPPFVNGSSAPPAEDLVVGETYRLRLIVISASTGYRIQLARGSELEPWRALARDGADLPVAQRIQSQGQVGAGPGMTFDFEYTPRSPGEVTLAVDAVNAVNGRPFEKPTVVLLRVR